jgi:phosphatidylglycerophosphate synthase
MAAPELPAFETVLKSRDVEDPVNLWVHRPLAYGFVALVYRSPITPNQVTLVSMLVGLASAACLIAGSPSAMVWAGALLWASAILDGADGILARAQQRFSVLGRALDGTADMVVGLSTVLAGLYHIWIQQHDATLFVVAPIAIVSAVLHIHLYDFYKESYMQMTNPQWNGEPERIDEVEERLRRARAERAGFAAVLASKLYVDLIRGQTAVVAMTNPWASKERLRFAVNEQTVASYRRHNKGPVKLWALISLAPHSYVMAICCMFDRLDVYLWLRLALGNALFAIVLLWQRAASRRTRDELSALGCAPAPLG